MSRPPRNDALPGLDAGDLAELTAFRHRLHAHPELSAEESGTAATIAARLRAEGADAVVEGLGGHGVAAVFDGGAEGPTVMIRSELDALPIEETGTPAHRSTRPGIAHLCGHDGHSAILCGLARVLGRQRPRRGRVVLLFQPAEETGAGAAAVIADPRFAALRPDLALSLHNLPGLPLGHAGLAEGPANCASMGLRIRLEGRTSHAAQPERGVPPTPAVAALLLALPGLSRGRVPEPGYRLATPTHARLGEPAFGIAPGAAEVWVTLRTLTDAAMAGLRAEAEALARRHAEEGGLAVSFEEVEPFLACTNHPDAVEALREAAVAEGLSGGPVPPLTASEDFGRFGALAPSAMVFLGAGEDSPALHNPDYDFPDALIDTGTRLFVRAIADRLGLSARSD